MKKIILSVAVIGLTLFVACKKEAKVIPTTNDQKIEALGSVALSKNPIIPIEVRESALKFTANNNMLVFATKEDYIDVVNMPSAKSQLAFIEKSNTIANFNSLLEMNKNTNANSKKTDLYSAVNDVYFSALLNENGCVQIAEYLYKINAITSKVYVIKATEKNALTDLLSENISNINVMQFSTNEEVLEALENKGKKVAGPFCNQRYAEVRSDGKNLYGTITYANADYNALGIYFNLKSTILTGSWPTNYKFDYSNPSWGAWISFKQRCGYTSNSGPIDIGYWNGTHQVKYGYQNVKALTTYWYGFKVAAQSNGAYLSDVMYINN